MRLKGYTRRGHPARDCHSTKPVASLTFSVLLVHSESRLYSGVSVQLRRDSPAHLLVRCNRFFSGLGFLFTGTTLWALRSPLDGRQRRNPSSLAMPSNSSGSIVLAISGSLVSGNAFPSETVPDHFVSVNAASSEVKTSFVELVEAFRALAVSPLRFELHSSMAAWGANDAMTAASECGELEALVVGLVKDELSEPRST